MADNEVIDQRWRDFKIAWNAYFKPISGDDDGESEWFRFICNSKTDFGVVRMAIARLAKRYAEYSENPRYASKPRLGEFKTAYYAVIKENAKERSKVSHGGGTVCGTCLGAGLVYVLAPRRSDWEKREFWPEDFRTFSMEDCTGFETARCPDCAEHYYSDERKRRIVENSMPITVPRGFHDFPPDWSATAASGAQVMAWYLQRNFER